jgi:hypothetical protein
MESQMLYRVQPGEAFMWSGIDSSLMDLAREAVDLDRLEWQPVESEHRHADVIAVALRYGTRTGTGIVFPAHYLSAVERPRKLLLDYEGLKKAWGHPSIHASDERREKVSPGWIEAGQEKEKAVWDSVRVTVLDAEKRAAEIMSAPARADLATWWKELGGVTA